MERILESKIDNIYVSFRYETWFLNEYKKINYLTVPITTILFNMIEIFKVDICKITNKILNETDIKKVSEMLRFSDGPHFFEKPTHIWINKKEYFIDYEKKRDLPFIFNMVDY